MNWRQDKYFRRARWAILVISSGIISVLLMGAHARLMQKRGNVEAVDLTVSLGLTDLALFTEARYTRHPSQADLHTPFQDHPLSFDHFPSGSLIGPPQHLPAMQMRTISDMVHP
jgi:hypothetical protein